MKLEQKLNFRVKDLENLSATTLYTGDLPPMGPGGFGSGSGGPKKDSYGLGTPIFTPNGVVNSNSIGMYQPLKIQPSPELTVRDFPNSGFQMHIHEGAGGITHFKHGKKYSEINSYDAAMADGGKPAYDAMELLEMVNKICGIKKKN